MDPDMKAIGEMIGRMLEENYIMLMEIIMKVNGLMIKLMDMGFIHILMGQFMKDNGKMINKMVKVFMYKNESKVWRFI
jgi:hypothetical protein